MLHPIIIHEIIESLPILFIKEAAQIRTIRTYHTRHIRQLELRIEIDLLLFEKLPYCRRQSLRHASIVQAIINRSGIRISQFINNRLMLIDKIAYKHPYSQRQHHIEIIKIYIDDKAAHRPDNQYQEATAQDSQKPFEIDVLLIRKPLLQLAMVAPDEEEHHDESGETINSSPHRKDVEIDIVARHAIDDRKHHKRQFQHHRLTPGSPSRLHQFHQHKAIEWYDKHIGS